MGRDRAAARAILAALFTLLLGVRLLAPAGFMPSFDHGTVTIVACPDAQTLDPGPAHHGKHSKQLHQPCPYASAGGPGSLAAVLPLITDVLILAAALLLGRTFLFLERSRAHDRPPLRGPPIPA